MANIATIYDYITHLSISVLSVLCFSHLSSKRYNFWYSMGCNHVDCTNGTKKSFAHRVFDQEADLK